MVCPVLSCIFLWTRFYPVSCTFIAYTIYSIGKTDVNPNDVGTRPSKVTISDTWETGKAWRTMEIESAKKLGFIKQAKSLRIKDDKVIMSMKRLGLLKERAENSQYLIFPTKYSFPKVVRIMSIVTGFVYKVREGLNKNINKLMEFSTEA